MPTRARSRRLVVATAALAAALLAVAGTPTGAALAAGSGAVPAVKVAANPVLGNFKHLVVIYEENHSFDNLYGNWRDVRGIPVEGLNQAVGANTTQVSQDGRAYGCLLQNDVNLTTPPLSSKCAQGSSSGSTAGTTFDSHFVN
ncbi:alkaline phosphatase family protein [Dermatophilaceae bacterium Soc4.6]